MADMRRKKIKVCFILPEKAQDSATHFMHKQDLIEELSQDIEFFVYAPHGWDIIKIIVAPFRGVRIFYVHYSFKGALLALAARIYSGSKILYWNCGMPWLYRRSWLEESLFTFILRHTTLVTGTPELSHEYTKRYGLDGRYVVVIPNYIRVSRMKGFDKDVARAKLTIPVDKKVILFLHRLSRRKGAHLLPGIIKEFEDREDVLFLIVGDGLEKRNLESQVSNFKLQDSIRFEGAIPNSSVSEYFAAADIYLMPSEEEGMPNALLEAMAAGVPFVASDVGGVREMVSPNLYEYILPQQNVGRFAETIIRLLENRELREQISQEERIWVERYDVSTIAPKVLHLLEGA